MDDCRRRLNEADAGIRQIHDGQPLIVRRLTEGLATSVTISMDAAGAGVAERWQVGSVLNLINDCQYAQGSFTYRFTKRNP